MPATTTAHRKLTQAELLVEVRTRFGDDPDRWAFVCPSCQDIATIADWRQALTDHVVEHEGKRLLDPGTLIGQQCLGRAVGALEGPQKEWKGRGCDWTAYGLFAGPWQIVMPGEDDEEKAGWSFPLADGDDPLTAVHVYRPGKFGKLEIENTRIVRVPDSHANWGRSGDPVVVRTLRISTFCRCGAERGTPQNSNEYTDGQHYSVDKWDNPCGHLDAYDTLLRKAGLVRQAS